MATIGTFTRPNGNTYTGAVKTLSINAKTTIKPAEKANDRAPDYRIFQGSVNSGPPERRPPVSDVRTSRSSWTTPTSPLRSTPP